MSGWRQRFRAPAGALPKGILNKAGIALAAVLVLIVIFASAGSEEEPAPGQAAERPGQAAPAIAVQAGVAIERLTADAIRAQRDEQARRREAAQALERRERDRALARDPSLAGLAYEAPAGTAGETAEGQLREELRLLEIRRRYDALRAAPVAHSVRPVAQAADGELPQPASKAPAAGAGRFLAELGVTPEQAAAAYSPEELAALEAVAASGALPEPADAAPTPLTRPGDPPGWERVFEGQTLEAVLSTQVRGDFAGPANAIVSAPLWSRDRQRVLVPRGTRAVGRAEAVSGWGQARLAVAFHRLVFPDSTYVRLRFEGLSQAGETGLRDRVNRHYLSTLGAAGAVGMLAGLTLRGSNPYGGGVEGARAGAGTGFGQASERILDRYLNRLPTITVRAGHRLRILFTSDVLVPRREPTAPRRPQP